MAKQDANMRALKGLVIGMGALIVVGLTIVIVTIAMRATGGAGDSASGGDGASSGDARAEATASGATPAPTVSRTRPFGELQLGMADSCRIADAVASGRALVVRVDGPAKDGCDQLVVVDPGQGRVLGRIRPGAVGDSAEAGQ